MSASQHSHTEEHQQHVLTPFSIFIKVFVALIILTILTYTTSLFDFGIMNIVVAMIIAATKASLVVMFFMQLKMDEIGNKVTFMASLMFLTVFILLTGSDLFFRRHEDPVKVQAVAAIGGETDQNKLRIATPALVAKGKELFHTNGCITCHGENGKGDGPAASALNPKPRNFTSGYWRYGGAPTRVFHTITNGSPGTAMASYAALPVADRYALAHYVRSLSPNHPDDTPEDLKAAGLMGGGKVVEEKPKQEIPIDVAMEQMEVPDQIILPSGAIKNPESSGAQIYMARCLACHGVNGVGSVVRALGVNPTVQLITATWVGTKAAWISNAADFEKIVFEGIPGRGMPGIANLDKKELSDLYNYAHELAQSQ